MNQKYLGSNKINFQVDLSPGGSSSGNKIGVISSSYRVSKHDLKIVYFY